MFSYRETGESQVPLLEIRIGIPSGNETWLAVKSLILGGLARKIIYKSVIFNRAMSLIEHVSEQIT